MAAMSDFPPPLRDPAPLLAQTLDAWGDDQDLWIFGYGSLIWRPDFDYVEKRPAVVHGWHRSLSMWSRVNRGTPDCPGLVFGMLSGGSCRGMVFRVDRTLAREVFHSVWEREMILAVYDPRWLPCQTADGPVRALAFTLSRRSPSHTGLLPDHEYRRIFSQAVGRYGSTRDYAQATHDALRAHGIHDRALTRLMALAQKEA
jgi:cation transport protein ChaC